LKKVVSLSVVIFLTGSLWFWLYSPGGLFRPILLTDPQIIEISPSSSCSQIAFRLYNQKVISNPLVFGLTASVQTFLGHPLKAGEYKIYPQITGLDLLLQLQSGQILIHYLTIPEGWSVSQICEKLEGDPNLRGSIQTIPPEGTLLPQTYSYLKGDLRSRLVLRMQKAMDQTLKRLWTERDPSIPIRTSQDALILASIIEKESSVQSEQPLIASVFYNRFQHKMRLQSDPTVIYAITLGRKSLSRLLTRADLKIDSPYNTYLYEGLPPNPISCPGQFAIQSVLHPSRTQYLYFVVDGKGGHNFSSTYSLHRNYVRMYRDRRDRGLSKLSHPLQSKS
jgi:UPF0755 protein